MFTGAGGLLANRVARWDGSTWSALGSGLNHWTFSMCVFDDGSGPALYASGDFTTAGGVPASRIARWDGTSWSAMGGGLDEHGWSMDVFDDGSGPGPALYVGGVFGRAIDTGDSNLARWSQKDTPPTIAAPDYVHVPDAGAPGEIVSFTVTASDTCDPAPSLTCVPPSGSFFPPGRTMVTCTASDSTGNQAVRRFPVFVGKVRRR
jgi:hypothetical protein